MEIRPVAQVLLPEGFLEPTLSALLPNQDNYTALLLQPLGNIEASSAGVRNQDRELAQQQFGCFLEDARQTNADIVVTPEYSLPWEVLAGSIRSGTVPEVGKLWALGCESISYADLGVLKQELAAFATLIFEPLEPDTERFTDPLAYVFVSPRTDDTGVGLVVLVQFKTHPMGDPGHFEINGLQLGVSVYEFGGGQRLRLLSLICSDAFAFLDPEAQTVYDRALIIHIQLNQKPRHEQYRQYRDRLFRFQGDATELICLNWAKDVREWTGQHEKAWNNISASAWYLKPDRFDDSDATLCGNHRRGLYYTWFQSIRAHALFFNFEPATFLFRATKVAHIGVPAAVSRRRGPQLVRRCAWDQTAARWAERLDAEDGFAGVIDESGLARDEIKQISDTNPFAVERLLALCAGKVEQGVDWYRVRQLDSCGIGLTEIIQRITFCQDTDTSACAFRTARLKRCANLWNILRAGASLPASLTDLKNGFHLEWSDVSPHQNLVSAEGQRATVIYMGEEASEGQIEATAMRAAEYLGRSLTDPDEILAARQRLAVLYRVNGAIAVFDSHRYVRIDQKGKGSEFDIGRER